MKLRFPISDFRFPIFKQSAKRPPFPGTSVAPATHHQPSALRPPAGRRGIALIITLIMLAVTLVMAVAFLALSRRERNAVSTTTDTATAQLATDSALAAAQAQIMASILATNAGAYNYGLLVSTNYINYQGYNPNGGPNGYGPASPTNVNYDYTLGGALLTAGERNQNIANLELLPRAPVYVVTNQQTGSNEFRFYLDLNRNGMDEPSSFVTNRDYLGNVIRDNNLNIVTNAQPGDPEWIGVLAHPDQPHGPDNQFVARYAFLAQPIGNSLDLNYIHNQTRNTSLGTVDGFTRNEGVGSWEINLAAFLADLNTNLWDPPTVENSVNNPYEYFQPGSQNNGVAFEDARALLTWRYNGAYSSLAIPPGYFQAGLYNSGIDGYSIGDVMIGLDLPPVQTPLLKNWAGSDNPNMFFSLDSDLFDPNKTTDGVPAANVSAGNDFSARLQNAGNSLATYDRYTFYRLLDQLGTGSSVDADRMNLNFRNVTNGVVVPGLETNLYPWTALDFFTNAADRLLRYSTAHWFAVNPTNYLATYYDITNFPNYISSTGYGLTNAYLGVTNAVPSFGVGNIPVYLNGKFVYQPAVNRLLQLAANMYDASTNSYYPSVFRPTYKVYRNPDRDVYINGFSEVQVIRSGVNDSQLAAPVDITALPNISDLNNINVYGVPWIIGARKGFPAFNQFYMRNTVQVTRKLQVTRTDPNTPGATGTNQMFTMSITNRLGYSFWNSYNATNFAAGSGLTIYARDIISMTLSNGVDGRIYPAFYGKLPLFQFAFSTNMSFWPGSGWTLGNQKSPLYQTPQPNSFISGYWDFAFLPESSYSPSSKEFNPLGTVAWDTGDPIVEPFPEMQLLTTNRIQAYILDNGHVIDYVELAGPNGVRRLDQDIADSRSNTGDIAAINNNTAMWDTNLFGVPGPTFGVINQIEVSRFNPAGTIHNFWKRPPNMPPELNTPALESTYFNAFFTGKIFVYNGKVYSNTNKTQQAPYTPTRTAWQYTSWQANDPLVHYLASDLNTITSQTGTHHADVVANANYPNPDLNAPGDRYQPWGRNKQMTQAGQMTGDIVDSSAYNLRYRDPLMWRSDDWDFPTNRYPTIGWLGRVHRGTPWQTVYLKARNVLDETTNSPGNPTNNVGIPTWAQWTGDRQKVNGKYYDALNSGPIQDEALFDLFTTRFNDNAVRGALSVNQTHLASWSAVLSGVVALTNVTTLPTSYNPPAITNLIIEPAGLAGNNSALGEIVNGTNGINATRAGFVNADGVRGTFEHVGDILRVPALTEQSPFLHTDTANQQNGISDELYEWLPQQTLGLLRVGGAPRYVVYCYGQTLRPAVDGTLLSGPYFNMVTNYQVTAESAARAVIRVDRHVTATGTNYTTVVESYNPLPPN